MTSFSFENELWAQDEQVDEYVTWAKEQNEWDLRELWLVIFLSGPDECIDSIALDFKNAPLNYRSN